VVTTRVRRIPRQGSLPQAVVVLVGVVLVLLGGLSLLATGFAGFAAWDPQRHLFGLSVNPLQGLLHLLVGLAAIGLSARLRRARRCGLGLAAIGLALFGYGVLAVQRPDVNVLNLDWAGNWLHLGVALAGLAAAIAPARIRTRRR
jgi:hypothetical protein